MIEVMTRQKANEAFQLTSFLHGANAAYIEELQGQYARNPGSVSSEWRRFFDSLNEQARASVAVDNGHGPSWAKPLELVEGNRELVAALTGDYGVTERDLREQLQARGQVLGLELSPIASMRATQDSIRALMLI